MQGAPLANVPCVLVIRDGWGENPHHAHDPFNAVRRAQTPVDDALSGRWPRTLIRTSGEDVGLPIGPSGPVMGNSEVGHQNIGAGRIVDQELMRITRAIRDGRFASNPALRRAFERARHGHRVHIMGLVSDGQVHSDISHLEALLELAAADGVPGDRTFVHAFTDGRDTAPRAGTGYLRRLEPLLARTGARIATISGRYWAMDRDHRWDRIERAWNALLDRGAPHAPSALGALERHYANPPSPSQDGDEFMPPTVIVHEGAIRDGDAVIFLNFRGDRPRELVKAFVLDDAALGALPGGGFARGAVPKGILFVTMAEYEHGLPVEVAFPRAEPMKDILGDWLASHGIAQFRCAETEKFPHVTFFFNDYREEPFRGERREIVPSPRDVATYDLKPQMSAEGVRDAVLARLAADDCEPVIIVNFANGDMVGHTGKLDATVAAIETVDACVGRIMDAALARGGSLIVTADHGNAEQMRDPASGTPHTAHTNYLVPLSVVGERFRGRSLRSDGRLADIAPTLLDMIGMPKPEAMTGRSLLVPPGPDARGTAAIVSSAVEPQCPNPDDPAKAAPADWTAPAAEPPPPRNRLAIIGFTLSMLGFFTCGISGMAGAIISAAALRQKPRAFAIAGVIVGLLQLCILTPITLGLLLPALAKARESARMAKVQLDLMTYQVAIEDMRAKGVVPSDPESIRMRAGAPAGETLPPTDPWGNAWRVSVDAGSGRARIESAGPDGRFDTEDDIRDSRIAPDAGSAEGTGNP
ncbi:MAG: 2,3-bisphosphoglycerate-independent phosphoglycerate mutase [Phycisphaerales bacterium]|nr:2,3-bisphosphoglycerate-independent phosphoglycerate mutase [Phycisphaerales bacterium]